MNASQKTKEALSIINSLNCPEVMESHGPTFIGQVIHISEALLELTQYAKHLEDLPF